MKLSGWGRFPAVDCAVVAPRTAAEVALQSAGAASLIARGNGRGYGDCALNAQKTVEMRGLDRMLAFDPVAGVLTCEAGVLLAEIIDVFLPRGWFLQVTPGTRFVSVGGAIAADVHGKNHHGNGAFGDWVDSIDLLLEDGRIVRCGPHEEPALFAATCGGMGLTGTILRARLRLLPVETAFIRQETLKADTLEAVMALFDASAAWTYSVAWIDCLARGPHLGRSLLYRGEHARRDDLPMELRAAPLPPLPSRTRRVPLDLPGWALNRHSVRAFNTAYFHRGRPGTQLVDLATFFYPLDGLLDWNRIYGRSGFVQYQCVLPRAASADGLRALLEQVSRAGLGSFLAVLKLFGAGSGRPLSFPLEGYTLALDFPANAGVFNLLLELDRIVADHGGRLYLAKDARMGAGMLRAGYPELAAFQDIRTRWNPTRAFRSLQSQRLGL